MFTFHNSKAKPYLKWCDEGTTGVLLTLQMTTNAGNNAVLFDTEHYDWKHKWVLLLDHEKPNGWFQTFIMSLLWTPASPENSPTWDLFKPMNIMMSQWCVQCLLIVTGSEKNVFFFVPCSVGGALKSKMSWQTPALNDNKYNTMRDINCTGFPDVFLFDRPKVMNATINIIIVSFTWENNSYFTLLDLFHWPL